MDRRLSVRQKSFLQGRVYFNNRRSSFTCLVRDISETGAKLQFPSAITTPEVMELHIPSRNESRRVRVEWHNGKEIGVSFNYEENAPPLVPGAVPMDWPARVEKLEHEVAALQRKISEMQSALRQFQGADNPI
jgi:hypothetical protein